MGIKFRCPNGHKLNVKSFLAGKRGVCPKCGTSVRIPQPSPEEAAEPADDGDDLLDEARFPAPGRASAVGLGNGVAATSTALPAAMPAMAAIPIAAPASGDPIAEAPAAVWYVRPPGGGQYGPARGDVMRRWLTEGRVSNDSIVWREDWSDWRAASDVFGALESAAPQPPSLPVSAPLPKEETPEPAPRAARLISRYEARKKQGSGLGIAAIVFLGLLCVMLAILLVYFVFGFPGGVPKSPSPQTGASSAAK
jgi:hypothetical protein